MSTSETWQTSDDADEMLEYLQGAALPSERISAFSAACLRQMLDKLSPEYQALVNQCLPHLHGALPPDATDAIENAMEAVEENENIADLSAITILANHLEADGEELTPFHVHAAAKALRDALTPGMSVDDEEPEYSPAANRAVANLLREVFGVEPGRS